MGGWRTLTLSWLKIGQQGDCKGIPQSVIPGLHNWSKQNENPNSMDELSLAREQNTPQKQTNKTPGTNFLGSFSIFQPI